MFAEVARRQVAKAAPRPRGVGLGYHRGRGTHGCSGGCSRPAAGPVRRLVADGGDLLRHVVGRRPDARPAHGPGPGRDTSVLYVDPPLSPLTPLRHPDLSGLARAATPDGRPRIARLTPAAPPGKGRPGVRHLTAALPDGHARAARRLGADVHAVSLSFPRAPVRGLRRAPTGAVRHRRLRRGGRDPEPPDGWCAARPTSSTTPPTSSRSPTTWRQVACHGRGPVVIPNGVDTTTTSTPTRAGARDVTLPDRSPVSWDTSLTASTSAADRRRPTGASLLLVGPRQLTFAMHEMEALLALPNVQWVGPKAFADFPRT